MVRNLYNLFVCPVSREKEVDHGVRKSFVRSLPIGGCLQMDRLLNFLLLFLIIDILLDLCPCIEP